MRQDLESVVKNNLFLEAKLLEKINNREYTPDMASNALWKANVDYAVNSFIINGHIVKFKLHLNTCGLIDEFTVNKNNNRFFDYGLHHISFAVLSDNEELIQRYAKLRYQRGVNAELSMDEMVAIGELPIWCNTVQFFMANDTTGVERNLNIIETKTLISLPKKEEGLKDDFEFYKALHNNDKAKMEEVLEKLVSPKIHKKRNDNLILNQYISLQALGYAKLAWRRGIEVDVNSNLIPKELLPVQPLDNYEIPYEFLK